MPSPIFSPTSVYSATSTLFVLTTEQTEHFYPTKMRRYDIVFVILLILSIIDFALAAPVMAQEKRRPRVDVMQIPKDEITVLGKRWDDEELQRMMKLLKEYVMGWPPPVESTDTHGLSSSAPPRPDHGSMNGVQAPAPNPRPSKDPDFDWDYRTNLPSPHENEVEHAQQPNLGPSTDPEFDRDHWTDLEDEPQRKRPKLASSKEFGQVHDVQVVHAQQPNPDSSNWFGLPDLLPPPKQPDPSSSREFGQVVHVQWPNPGPLNQGTSNGGPSDPTLRTGLGYGVVNAPSPMTPDSWLSEGEFEDEEETLGPPPSPELTDSEFHSDDQSLSVDNVLAAIYGAKGKAPIESWHLK